jgi:thiamine biosynthesis lipoprotein
VTTHVVESGPDGLIRSTFRAMASDVTIVTPAAEDDHEWVVSAATQIFEDVELQCTRFDPHSDLMRANGAQDWTRVGPYCYRAIQAAYLAYRATDGWFDPRVLRVLEHLGYATSLPFAAGPVTTGECVPLDPPTQRPWRPRFDEDTRSVFVGPDPVGRGAIGKGLAVRWAAARASELCQAFVLDAGGDCYLHGRAPDGQPWRIGIEDPRGRPAPLAVLAVSGAACATSSIRLRRWQAGRRTVHHLIDPRTGEPGGDGLLAVTVIESDPARAEILSKVMFLHGSDGIREATETVAAAWVDATGALHLSDAMRPYLIWPPA